jgi:hypothetical protein
VETPGSSFERPVSSTLDVEAWRGRAAASLTYAESTFSAFAAGDACRVVNLNRPLAREGEHHTQVWRQKKSEIRLWHFRLGAGRRV